MVNANRRGKVYAEIHHIKRRHDEKINTRAAALISVIDKIAATYQVRGIFPDPRVRLSRHWRHVHSGLLHV